MIDTGLMGVDIVYTGGMEVWGLLVLRLMVSMVIKKVTVGMVMKKKVTVSMGSMVSMVSMVRMGSMVMSIIIH